MPPLPAPAPPLPPPTAPEIQSMSYPTLVSNPFALTVDPFAPMVGENNHHWKSADWKGANWKGKNSNWKGENWKGENGNGKKGEKGKKGENGKGKKGEKGKGNGSRIDALEEVMSAVLVRLDRLEINQTPADPDAMSELGLETN